MKRTIYFIPKKLTSILVDFFIIDVVLIITLILVSTDLEKKILSNFQGVEFISYLLSGIFAVNFITALPSLTFQSKIVSIENINIMTLFITIGNVIGDYLIFHFIRFRLLENVAKLMKKSARTMSILHSRNPILKGLLIIAGGGLILSPLPDEIGILLLGISKIKSQYFLAVSLILNLIGTYLFLRLFI